MPKKPDKFDATFDTFVKFVRAGRESRYSLSEQELAGVCRAYERSLRQSKEANEPKTKWDNYWNFHSSIRWLIDRDLSRALSKSLGMPRRHDRIRTAVEDIVRYTASSLLEFGSPLWRLQNDQVLTKLERREALEEYNSGFYLPRPGPELERILLHLLEDQGIRGSDAHVLSHQLSLRIIESLDKKRGPLLEKKSDRILQMKPKGVKSTS